MAKGYGEAMALFEMGKQTGLALAKAEEKMKPQRTEKPEKKDKPPSWEQLWLEEQQRRAKFDDMMKVIKKQLAEEPKKEDDKKKWFSSIDHVAMVLLATMSLNWAILYFLFR